MKQTVWRTVLREISTSRGRFLAILMIVGLGVGFFSGLRVAQTAMLETTRRYYRTHHFFDWHILSDLGFTQKEVDMLSDEPDVLYAEGAVTMDAICVLGNGQERVLRLHSLPERVNGIKLVYGRMPEGQGECMADSALFTQENLGDKLRISSGNEAEEMEKLAVKEYEIVGIAQSSYYIHADRGNTSIGNGQIGGFLYIERSAFDMEYFTDVFVCMDRDMPLYSAAYEDFMEERRQGMEEAAQAAALERYESVTAEAREKLEEARKELETARAEGNEKLSEARAELETAEQELRSGEQELEKGRRRLEEARDILAQKESELAEGEAVLQAEKVRLEEAAAALEKGRDQWDAGSRRVEEGKAELEKQAAQLASGREELNAREQELLQGKALLEEQERELAASEAALNSQREELEKRKKELEAQLRDIDAGEQELLLLYGAVPEEQAKAFAEARSRIQEYMEQIREAEAGLEEGLTQIEEGKEKIRVTGEQLEEGLARIEEAGRAMTGYEQELAAGQRDLAEADRELAEGLKELNEGEEKLLGGRAEAEEAERTLADGRRQLEDARAKIERNERTLKARMAELEQGWATYRQGLEEYGEKEAEFLAELEKAEGELAKGERELADVEKPESYVLDRGTNIAYATFENDAAAVAGIANVFPVFFFAVAVLVCVTTMNRMVEEQRSQIGLMKALGYSEGSIMAKYMLYSGLAALVGGLSGFLGGTWFFPRAIWTAYGISYRVERLIYVFDWKLAILSLMVAALCSVGSTWFTCRYELLEAAARLMRPKAPKAGKRVLLEYVKPVWSRMRFLYKVSYRNIFRYKGRFFMMLIGIGGCCALLVTGFGVRDSISSVADRQFDEIQTYDLTVTLKKEMNEDVRGRLEEALGESLESMLAVMEKTVDIRAEKGTENVILIVPQSQEEIGAYIDLHTEEGKKIAYPGEGELVIGNGMAKRLGAEKGSELVLAEEKGEMLLLLADKNENFLYNYAYVTSSSYRMSMGEEPVYKTVYVKLKEDADPYRAAASLMKQRGVAAVMPSRDVRSRFNNMMDSLNLIVILVILAAGGLALIVLYNLTNINITERIREIATIKVLGFYTMETAAYVFRENMVLTAIGSAAGLVLGRLLHMFVMNSIPMEAVSFDIYIRPVSYVYSVLLTVLFTFLVNLLMMRRLEAIHMAESLKSVD